MYVWVSGKVGAGDVCVWVPGMAGVGGGGTVDKRDEVCPERRGATMRGRRKRPQQASSLGRCWLLLLPGEQTHVCRGCAEGVA